MDDLGAILGEGGGQNYNNFPYVHLEDKSYLSGDLLDRMSGLIVAWAR